MKIRVLKGTDEIGGNCIEISTPNTTILLDYGTPLKEKSQKVTLEQKIDAILISHPHQDHFGEIINLDSKTPIYCGELSFMLMNATKIFTGNEKLTNSFHHFVAWQKFTIGDFTITPYLVDHSATDAYAFLVEAENQKILYSGDFRDNGRKSKLFYKMIKDKNLKNIDVLMMEGTMMQRGNLDFPDEQSVENKIYEVLTSNENLSFLIGSSQNIDSIVSAYRACKKANKIFVVDIYTAWILEVVSQKSKVPNISWDDVKVIKSFGGSYYEKIKTEREYFGDFVNRVFDDVVTLEELENNPSKYLLKITPWVIEALLEKTNLQTANIIYSQWLGYLKEEFSESKTVTLFENLQTKYNWHYAHTGGHADLKSLQTFASSLSPKKLIPIHTEHKGEFVKHFKNVVILKDNEEYSVGQRLSELQVDELNELFKDNFLEEDGMEFLEKLMNVIVDEGVNTPKAQVERYLSPILTIFLAEILKSKFGNEYIMITPEFPIKKGTLGETNRPNQSTNIDYLMFNDTQKKFTFIELKTDSSSFKPSQLDIYNQLEKISREENKVFGQLLYDDLLEIKKASSYKDKYQHLIEKKWKTSRNSINEMEIIYIVPAKTKLKEKHPTLQTLYFSDFPQSLNIYTKEYEIINLFLKKLDKN